MALRTLSALAKAIDAVKKEAGTFEEYKPLLDALSGVSKELGGADAAGDAKDASSGDPFQEAEQKHKEHTAAKIDAAKAASAAADKPTPGDEPDAAAPDGAAK